MATAALLLRTLGPRFRVARLLSAAVEVPIEEAVELARGGAPRYMRVRGRVSSEAEFPDENDRPLVFRRRRLEARTARGTWRSLEDERLAVPFGVEQRGAFLAVDVEALGDGLVVLPRESEGRASELPEDLRGRLDPESVVRLRIEQVSAVELATIAGVAALVEGVPTMTAGLGRPLVLTTLELAAAMRVAAGTGRARVLAVVLLLVAGTALLAIALALWLVGLAA